MQCVTTRSAARDPSAHLAYPSTAAAVGNRIYEASKQIDRRHMEHLDSLRRVLTIITESGRIQECVICLDFALVGFMLDSRTTILLTAGSA
jgi:hypothetical protein